MIHCKITDGSVMLQLPHVNHCPAMYIFQAKTYLTQIVVDNIVCGRFSVSQITQFRRCTFSKNINMFRHLELDIVLAIPASNDENYN